MTREKSNSVLMQKVEKALDNPTKGTVDSVFDLLKTEIFRPNHEWNADQTTVNVQNGELFWTGEEWELQPHCREHFLTTQLPVKYNEKSHVRTHITLPILKYSTEMEIETIN